MDLEGFAKRGLHRNDPEIASKLVGLIREVKDLPEGRAEALAEAVLEEARATLNPRGEVFELEPVGVSMGDFGVGSRGSGDFYTHTKIAEVIGRTDAVVDSRQLDDSGVVQAGGQFIVVTVDGMHSRLSDYPFLAGFHVTRAALRDIYVMGAKPVALLSDIHLADDGDVSRLFDHIAGIATVSELIDVPLVTGSTLRIGGDMVIGDRLTGCVGAVGVAKKLTPRKDATPGDVILMTEGAGGGTICSAALYYGRHEVVEETLNIKFLEASEALLHEDLTIHAMTDVTNGGIRGDAKEISHTAGVKLVFEEERMHRLVNPRVLEMLESLEIDYLGVSIDALLIIAPPDAAAAAIRAIRGSGVAVEEIGRVEKGSGAQLHLDGRTTDFAPRFRESAYTPVKKVVGQEAHRDVAEMMGLVDAAALKAVEKKRRFVEKVKRK
ncbi:MAG: thiamine monophosphate kinase [Methanosaeta sp. PtaU1.Bin060]|jgi:hydrogenase expression/formation protein|nr:MAG: thiamine monophosphate kinase [Methanosaeta sp. PtaU1.Bin060]